MVGTGQAGGGGLGSRFLPPRDVRWSGSGWALTGGPQRGDPDNRWRAAVAASAGGADNI